MMDKSKTMWKLCWVKILHSSNKAASLPPKVMEVRNLDKVELEEAKLLALEVIFPALAQIQQTEEV